MVFLIFVSSPYDEKFRVRIRMALSKLIRIMTQIYVESSGLVVPTNQRALNTYPCHEPVKCGQCHTYLEAELFIFGGIFKY